MKDGPIEICYGFFCESIRTEMSGQVTAIGIWGESCVFNQGPPLILPILGVHFFVKNPAQKKYNATLTINIPDAPKPYIQKIGINPVREQTSQNFNFNIANIIMKGPGQITAEFVIDTEPKTLKLITLNISSAVKTPEKSTVKK